MSYILIAFGVGVDDHSAARLFNPEQGLLMGQLPSSMCSQGTGSPWSHSIMPCMSEFALSAGMRYLASQRPFQLEQTWLEQEGAQKPFFGREVLMALRTLVVLAWYSSVQARCQALHPANEPPFSQKSPRMYLSDHESQGDWMENRGTLMQKWLYSANMHFHFSSWFDATHSLVGGSTSALEIFMKFWNCSLYSFRFVMQFMESRKIPESGREMTLVFFEARSTIQLVQRKVAKPPADCPVTMISVALNSPQRLFRESSCPMVTLCPLKYKFLFLQGMGSFLQPWWPVPSQYLRQTMVQSRYALRALSESIPSYCCQVCPYLLLLPKSVLLLPRQSSRVYGSPTLLPHQPPPSKLSRNLFFWPPWQMQQAPRVPSRQRASG